MRRHFMFLYACGCPFGLTDYRPRVTTEAQAWAVMYDTKTEARDDRDRGVHVRLVDHETYSREYYHLMTQRCPHADRRPVDHRCPSCGGTRAVVNDPWCEACRPDKAVADHG